MALKNIYSLLRAGAKKLKSSKADISAPLELILGTRCALKSHWQSLPIPNKFTVFADNNNTENILDIG